MRLFAVGFLSRQTEKQELATTCRSPGDSCGTGRHGWLTSKTAASVRFCPRWAFWRS